MAVSFLHQRRIATIIKHVRKLEATSIADLGCGSGDLIDALLGELDLDHIVGIDVDDARVETARKRFETAGDTVDLRFMRASLTEPLDLPRPVDAAILLEVIEHVEIRKLPALEANVFGHFAPRHVLVTTPNSEYNHLLGVPSRRFRHPGHTFEWDREAFGDWAQTMSERYRYDVEIGSAGGSHPRLGGPSHLAIFTRAPAWNN